MPFLRTRKKKETWFVVAERETYKTGLRDSIYDPSGSFYKGEWFGGLQSGKGKRILPNGKQYEGDWVRNKRHGFGVTSDYTAEKRKFQLTYVGDFFNGKVEGFGRRNYNDGSVYEGEFKKNRRHGFGRCWYADKSYYEGQWLTDQCHGFGMFVQVNGNRYEGEWKNGEKDGWGRFYHLDSGQVQDGFWVKGICTTSFLKDISYRQSALQPTPYPIPPVTIHPEASCVQHLNQAAAMLLKYNEGCLLHKYCYLAVPSHQKSGQQNL